MWSTYYQCIGFLDKAQKYSYACSRGQYLKGKFFKIEFELAGVRFYKE
jgi:hypothetical protein